MIIDIAIITEMIDIAIEIIDIAIITNNCEQQIWNIIGYKTIL